MEWDLSMADIALQEIVYNLTSISEVWKVAWVGWESKEFGTTGY